MTIRTVRRWSPEAHETLWCCFEAKNWEVLTEPYGEVIEGLTHSFTGYINFCVDNVVSAWTVTCFFNNKPWITRDFKTLLIEKKDFRTGDREGLKLIQRVLRIQIKEVKNTWEGGAERHEEHY